MQQQKKTSKCMLEIEKSLYSKGYSKIVGIDEAGRGPLAGPVVAAAVIFPIDIKPFIFRDSKKLSPKERERLFHQIKENAVSVGIGIVDSTVIDRINIYNATKLAMERALEDLKTDYDYIITDYVRFDPYPHISVKKADEKSLSVAAASIIAKVIRDRIMEEFSKVYPHSFDRHKGYPTKLHREEIMKYGLTPIHRKSFNTGIQHRLEL
ncbi:ribonuclease HII [Persephonella atlantica]|uniref:ribonuclease HII n=1 Tax=Persephonella atlantica TaxID=2699429 RepID=UPI001F5B72B4|nr:ribonuclease HII [Persephonella atlantica]